MSHQHPPVPPVLPHARIDVDAEGRLAVTVDGQPSAGESEARPSRHELGRVVRDMTSTLGCPVRVELHEADGRVLTEIVTPGDTAPPPADPPTALAAPAPVRCGVVGDGFLPGEQVQIALVVASCTADQAGVAELRLPPALLARMAGPVVLFGRSSGTLLVTDPARAADDPRTALPGAGDRGSA